jgi:hypothetical protein
MPSASIFENSALAAANFSLSKRQNFEAMGGPVVIRWCSTSCFTVADVAAVPKKAGNSRANCCSNAVTPQVAACGPAVLCSAAAATEKHVLGGVDGQLMLLDAAGGVIFGLGISLLFAGSTNSLKYFRKSTPMMGKLTAANKKFQANRRRPNSRWTRQRPQQGIFVPSVPTNAGPYGLSEE